MTVCSGGFLGTSGGPTRLPADDLRTIALGFVQVWMTDAVEAEARAIGDDGAGARVWIAKANVGWR